MTHTELERSYVFKTTNIAEISAFLGTTISSESTNITDSYLSPDTRIRETNDQLRPWELTRKTGHKRNGIRTEENHTIGTAVANCLKSDARLVVSKRRHSVNTNVKNLLVTLDTIVSPMTLSIIEIESTDGKPPPTLQGLFGVEAEECPFAAWGLFRQKIGVCGAPSSGKTEAAKHISYLLSTKFGANSFYVPEYATSFIQKYGITPEALDQFVVWYSQMSAEQHASAYADMVVSDCPTFLAYIYAIRHNHLPLSKQLKIHLTKLYERVIDDISQYSRIVYLPPQKFVSNNIRFHNNDEISAIDKQIVAFLDLHQINYITADRNRVQDIVSSIMHINDINAGIAANG